jgi:hypothetical protein
VLSQTKTGRKEEDKEKEGMEDRKDRDMERQRKM